MWKKDQTMTSTNGRDWTLHTPVSGREIESVAGGNGRFVAVGKEGSSSETDAERARTFFSTDGLQWETNAARFQNNLQSVVWVKDHFLAMGDDGHLVRSDDGTSWTEISISRDLDLHGITRTSDRFIAVGDDSKIWCSSDGERWTAHSLPLTVALGVAHGRGVTVVCGENGSILVSTNLLEWVQVRSGTGTLYDIIFDGDRFLAVGEEGTLLSSEDGRNWESLVTGTSKELRRIAYLEHRYLVVGEDVILSSLDTITWSLHPVSGKLWAVAFGNGRFVAVGDDRFTAYTSVDGISWQPLEMSVKQRFRDVVFWGGHFVACAENGRVYSSLDGTLWIEHYTGCSNDLNRLLDTDKGLIAIGNNQAILQSRSLLPELDFGHEPGAKLGIAIHGFPGVRHTVQGSHDLTNWDDIEEFTTSDGKHHFSIENSENAGRFFRVIGHR
jgi:photosystem II stability/assembly factor-like uncharacterized protein